MIERLPLQEVSRKADAIVERLISEFGSPDLVVGIANGGLYLGDLVAKASERELHWIAIGKQLNLDELYDNPHIPHTLARLLHGYRFMTRPVRVEATSDMPGGAQLIVLVDDTVHTGKTMQLAYTTLKKRFPEALIVTAAINSVRGVGADIILHDRKRLWFPWSKQSAEYEAYKTELAARGLADLKKLD